jgi:hypothetical protein
VWAETRHTEHPEFTLTEMLETEREHLMPMPEAFDGYVEKASRVSSTCPDFCHLVRKFEV